MVKERIKNLKKQSVSTHLSEELYNELQHCLLLACHERLLSRGFIGLIKMKILKMGI